MPVIVAYGSSRRHTWAYPHRKRLRRPRCARIFRTLPSRTVFSSDSPPIMMIVSSGNHCRPALWPSLRNSDSHVSRSLDLYQWRNSPRQSLPPRLLTSTKRVRCGPDARLFHITHKHALRFISDELLARSILARRATYTRPHRALRQRVGKTRFRLRDMLIAHLPACRRCDCQDPGPGPVVALKSAHNELFVALYLHYRVEQGSPYAVDRGH
jgi:hypothetical protein